MLFGQTLRLGKAGGKLFCQIRPGSDIYQTNAIVTEKGVVERPDTARMRALFGG